MPETIKFDLRAKMAIIKRPESNETYYTYNFPHKIVMMGILGAIIGLNGYNYYGFKKYLNKPVDDLPEFYSKLCNLKIAIAPKITSNNFSRKIQIFNNTVGYAGDKGSTLLVKEQWLEDPWWEVYILDNNTPEYDKIKDYLLDKKCEYIPYIGKNDHYANICNVKIEKANVCDCVDQIDSIFINNIKSEYSDVLDRFFAFDTKKNVDYEYKEVLPTKLNSKIGYTDFKQFIFTNRSVNINDKTDIYLVNNKNIYYF